MTHISSSERAGEAGRTAHTPGPWRFRADPYPDGTPYFRFKAGEPYVEGEKMGFEFSAIMREENARLIAAAPDLVKALEQIQELSKPGQDVSVSQAVDLLCDIWNVARAALSAKDGR